MWKKHPSFPPHTPGRKGRTAATFCKSIYSNNPPLPALVGWQQGSQGASYCLFQSDWFAFDPPVQEKVCSAVLMRLLGWLSLLRCPFMFKNKHLNSQPYPQSTRLWSCALLLLCFPLPAPWCIIYINKLDTKAVTYSVFFFLPLPLLTWILSPCSLCSSRFPATWSTVITQMWGYKYLNLPQVNMLPALCMRSRFVHPMSCLKDTGKKKNKAKRKKQNTWSENKFCDITEPQIPPCSLSLVSNTSQTAHSTQFCLHPSSQTTLT